MMRPFSTYEYIHIIIVTMTLKLVTQVVRPDYSVINMEIQYSGVVFEHYIVLDFVLLENMSIDNTAR